MEAWITPSISVISVSLTNLSVSSVIIIFLIHQPCFYAFFYCFQYLPPLCYKQMLIQIYLICLFMSTSVINSTAFSLSHDDLCSLLFYMFPSVLLCHVFPLYLITLIPITVSFVSLTFTHTHTHFPVVTIFSYIYVCVCISISISIYICTLVFISITSILLSVPFISILTCNIWIIFLFLDLISLLILSFLSLVIYLDGSA